MTDITMWFDANGKDTIGKISDSGDIYLSLVLGQEKAVAPHSNILAWELPWTEEPGRLQSMGLQRVGHDWATSLSLFTFMHWRGMATHSSALAWRIPGTAEPGGLQSMGSHRVRHDWSDLAAAATVVLGHAEGYGIQWTNEELELCRNRIIFITHNKRDTVWQKYR